MIDEDESHADRNWVAKFRCAFRGAKLGVRGQSSFFIHFFMAAAVIVGGVVSTRSVRDEPSRLELV